MASERRNVAVLIALGTLSGCSLPSGSTHSTLPAEPIFSAQITPAFARARQIVVRSDDQWNTIRQSLPEAAELLPAIDFSHNTVVLAALGLRPTGGYTIP